MTEEKKDVSDTIPPPPYDPAGDTRIHDREENPPRIDPGPPAAFYERRDQRKDTFLRKTVDAAGIAAGLFVGGLLLFTFFPKSEEKQGVKIIKEADATKTATAQPTQTPTQAPTPTAAATAEPDSTPQTTSEPVETAKNQGAWTSRTIKVNADEGWTDSGITIKPGMVISLHPRGMWDEGGTTVDHKGTGDTDPQALVPEAPKGCLIGRIGDQVFSILGNGFYEAKVLEGGRLYLSMNDAPGDFSDNSGTLRVSLVGPASHLEFEEVPAPSPAKDPYQAINDEYEEQLRKRSGKP